MKKAWFVSIIVLLYLCVMGGYVIYERLFPIAAPINCPNEEDITVVSLAKNNETSIMLEASDIEELLQNIQNVQPTRQMSVNDYPVVDNYYIIEIDTPERRYRYFIYTENSEMYIESPYEGVYKMNQQFWDFMMTLF